MWIFSEQLETTINPAGRHVVRVATTKDGVQQTFFLNFDVEPTEVEVVTHAQKFIDEINRVEAEQVEDEVIE